MVHLSSGMNAPASTELLSEPAIVARMAAATLGERSRTRWTWLVEDYDRIRDAIARVFDDFHDFNARVRVPGGFRLPNAARERRWTTPAGRAVFMPHAIARDTPVHRARATSAERVFTLATTRSHDQYNTTIYGLDDRYRGVRGERRVLFIGNDDIALLGLRAGDRVDVRSLAEDGIERVVRGFLLVANDLPRGCLAAYYPETNPLVPLSSLADEARTPTSKSIPVVLVPHDATAAPVRISRDIAATVTG